MGAFFGSVHVRTDDADSIRVELETLAAGGERRFLIAPPIRGWVSVFPSGSGQDWTVSEELSRIVTKPILHCIVHDDDVFTYRLYRSGVMADEYNSAPGYFDPNVSRDQRPAGGRVELLREFLPKPEKLSDLHGVLSEPRASSPFEQFRLERFAKLLALPNACTSYEYLLGGERDGIQQWKRFVHVPDLTSQQAAKHAAASQARAALKRLARQGLLLADLKGARASHRLFCRRPVWCIAPKTNDVFFCWGDVNMVSQGSRTQMLRLNTHNGQQSPLGCEVADTLTALLISPSERWLVVGCAFGNWTVQLWDLSTQQLRKEIPQSRSVDAMCFSADEQLLFTVSQGKVTVLSLSELRTVGELRLSRAGRVLAPHPSGEILAFADTQGLLLLVDVRRLAVVKTAWIGAKATLETAQVELAAPEAMERVLKELRIHMSADELARYRTEMSAQFLPKESITALQFSPDGRWLACGTNVGVHVFEWGNLLASAGDGPLRIPISVEAESVECDLGDGCSTESRRVYAVAFDSVSRRVLFSGLEGKVRFIELADGRCGDLLVQPQRGPITELGLTPDRSALVCTFQRTELRKEGPVRLQVWNYPALCKAAGVSC